ncbi:MAG: shikimate dehydrogenase, partial [Actinomycetes bacterium]
TAACALGALAALRVGRTVVYARGPVRAAEITQVAGRLGLPVEVRPWEQAAQGLGAQLVVSTTPAGAPDHLARLLGGAGRGTLFDVVYAPWPTVLAQAWAAAGGRVLGGLDLLVAQGVHQVVRMLAAAGGDGTDPTVVEVVRTAMRQAAVGSRPG